MKKGEESLDMHTTSAALRKMQIQSNMQMTLSFLFIYFWFLTINPNIDAQTHTRQSNKSHPLHSGERMKINSASVFKTSTFERVLCFFYCFVLVQKVKVCGSNHLWPKFDFDSLPLIIYISFFVFRANRAWKWIRSREECVVVILSIENCTLLSVDLFENRICWAYHNCKQFHFCLWRKFNCCNK